MTSSAQSVRPAALALAAALVGGFIPLAQADDAAALAAAAKEKGAVTTASGLVFLSTKEGSGPKPGALDTVKVNYRGTFTDGREFDSSAKNGGPISFPLNRVIKCWTEGVQMMHVGGKARLTCPSAIAYGPRGAGGGAIPPDSTLLFDVELLAINGK